MQAALTPPPLPGGRLRAAPLVRQRGSGSLSEHETHILQYLGAAVLLRWNELPTHIQRELFEHALVDVEPGKVTMLKEQIARFLHKQKDDSKSRS